jgi:hypothetical protein
MVQKVIKNHQKRGQKTRKNDSILAGLENQNLHTPKKGVKKSRIGSRIFCDKGREVKISSVAFWETCHFVTLI